MSTFKYLCSFFTDKLHFIDQLNFSNLLHSKLKHNCSMSLNIHRFFNVFTWKKIMLQHNFQIKQITLGIEDIPNNLQSPKHWVSKLIIKKHFNMWCNEAISSFCTINFKYVVWSFDWWAFWQCWNHNAYK